MTMSRCFSTVFDEPMKAKGFKRKGILYYRIHGDMLQGVTLKTTNPYIISYNFQPWWTLDLCDHRGFSTEKYITKHVWADLWYKWGYYFEASKEEESLDGMRDMLEWVENHVIPILDSVLSVDDYIQIHMDNIDQQSPIPELYGDLINQYAFLYKAWKDGTFEYVNRMFNDLMDHYVEKEFSINRFVSREYRYDQKMKYQFSVLASKMETNDYSSFGELYEAECEKMRELLQTHLKLTV